MFEIEKEIKKLETQNQNKSEELKTVKSRLKVLKDKIKSEVKQIESENDAGGEGDEKNYNKETKELEVRKSKLTEDIKEINGIVNNLKEKKNILDKGRIDNLEVNKQKDQIIGGLTEYKKDEIRTLIDCLWSYVNGFWICNYENGLWSHRESKDLDELGSLQDRLDSLQDRLGNITLSNTLLLEIENIKKIPRRIDVKTGKSGTTHIICNEVFKEKMYELLEKSVGQDVENDFKFFLRSS